jgi:prolyl-tRNA synthetase
LRLNQWNSVVRWEFKHPQPFLRTREFLWQEGHTAHLTREGAEEEVMQILDWYAEVYERLLAVPVVKGKKTDAEKFAGSFFSTTVEGYIPTTGRGIQGGTSHCLGQNFSKMFNIVVENPDGQDKPKIHVWQNSWGLSTRVLGVMVMVHSDNKGLVIPPMVAETQLVVIPCGLTAKTTTEEREAVIAGAKNIESTLAGSEVRVLGDFRDNYSPGWKFSDWELRGVPLRIEFGPADMKKDQVVAVRRDNGVKTVIAIADLTTKIPELLKTIQGDMYARAKKSYDDHRVHVKSIDEIVPLLNKKCVILAPFCGEEDCEDDIKERTGKPAEGEEVDERAPSMGAKSLCIPFDQPQVDENAKCIGCGKKAKFITQFGRSY